MSCKNCIHRTMCKYTDDFLAAEKKLTETVASTVKELPFKPTAVLTFECTMFIDDNPTPVAKEKKEVVKRKRKTKAEVEKTETEPAKTSEKKTEEKEILKEETVKPEPVEEKKEETPAPTLEETFSEIEPVKDEKKKAHSVEIDNENKKRFLDMKVDEFLALTTPEDVKKELLDAGVKTAGDCYKPELTRGLSEKTIDCLNKALALFHMDKI